MRTTSIATLALLTLIASMVLLVASFSPAHAGVSMTFTNASRPADIRVWLEAGEVRGSDVYYVDHNYDVYPSVDGVVLNVRASRSTYATVYVVDTAGYIHVVYPLSPYDNTYLRGGVVYSFYLSDFDLAGAFDRGVAYAFAVSSPVRFSYARYGMGAFAGNFGFQIYGDPYIAARDFYLELLPSTCNLAVVGVSYTRFYVREYVRYPNYLCAGWHDYKGARRYCRAGCDVYRSYSVHVSDPYGVLRPVQRPRSRSNVRSYTDIVRTNKWRDDVRENTIKKSVRAEPIAYETRVKKTIRKQTVGHRSVQQSNIVKSSKGTFIRGKKDLSTMREQLRKRSFTGQDTRRNVAQHKAGGEVKKVSKKTHIASARSSKKSEKATADKDAKSKSKGKERQGSR